MRNVCHAIDVWGDDRAGSASRFPGSCVNRFETFGLVAAEAMSHGVPVVAARIGALKELVEDGVDGLLFERGDPRDLAAALRRVWDDPDLCRRMGQAAREKRFSPRRNPMSAAIGCAWY